MNCIASAVVKVSSSTLTTTTLTVARVTLEPGLHHRCAPPRNTLRAWTGAASFQKALAQRCKILPPSVQMLGPVLSLQMNCRCIRLCTGRAGELRSLSDWRRGDEVWCCRSALPNGGRALYGRRHGNDIATRLDFVLEQVDGRYIAFWTGPPNLEPRHCCSL